MHPNLLTLLTPQEQAMLRHPTPHLMPGCACCHDLPAILTALAEARQQLQQAREAVEEYGEHLSGCPLTRFEAYDPVCGYKYAGQWMPQLPECTCGFQASLAGGTDG